MDIDMSALRALEREKDISLDVVVEAIETALLSAYQKTPYSHPHARVVLDRQTGRVTVWAKDRPRGSRRSSTTRRRTSAASPPPSLAS
jgi:N utilization substance protein A